MFGGERCANTYANGDRIAFVATVFDATALSGAPRGDGGETSDARFFTEDEVA